MKRFNLTSIAVLLVAGALTAFLWLPLLPMIVPLVALALGLKRMGATLDSEARLGKHAQQPSLLYFPNTHVPQNQASQPTAWSPLASLPSPARAGSLPLHSKASKSFKKQLRESRQIARVMSGLELRKSAPGY